VSLIYRRSDAIGFTTADILSLMFLVAIDIFESLLQEINLRCAESFHGRLLCQFDSFFCLC
jgi:hypothetical protein